MTVNKETLVPDKINGTKESRMDHVTNRVSSKSFNVTKYFYLHFHPKKYFNLYSFN